MVLRCLLVGVWLTGLLFPAAGGGAPHPRRADDFRSGKILDQGVFLLSLGGRTVGTEKFEIRSFADKVEARAQIQLHVEQNGKTYDLEDSPDLTLDSQLNPLTYSWTQKGSPAYHLTIDFRSSPAHIVGKPEHGPEDQREVALAQDVIVLDDNVIHHFQVVVDRYARTSGGKQTFKAFVPQEALPGELTVEDVGSDSASHEGEAANLRHLVITTDLARIEVWVDNHDRLQRVAIPDKQFEAIRAK